MFSSLVGAKLAVIAVAGSLSLGGVAAAAVTGTLPGPFHQASGAAASGEPQDGQGASQSADPTESADPTQSADPSASTLPTATPSGSASANPSSTAGPVGPDATGPAAFGLCHAFGGTKAVTKAGNPSVARRNLLAAATAAGQTIEVYCAGILGTPTPTTTATPTPTGPVATHGHGRGHGHGHGHGRP
jgi:hypothetical protein